MTTIYFIDANGKKVAVEVTDEVAAADVETRRAIWRGDAKERYYRDPALHDLNDHDEELACDETNPETQLIEAEERRESRVKLAAALKVLTPEQIRLIRMLKDGMSVSEIATELGVDHSAVSHMRQRIQKKIEKYLK